jgi:hypothetical protein
VFGRLRDLPSWRDSRVKPSSLNYAIGGVLGRDAVMGGIIGTWTIHKLFFHPWLRLCVGSRELAERGQEEGTCATFPNARGAPAEGRLDIPDPCQPAASALCL